MPLDRKLIHSLVLTSLAGPVMAEVYDLPAPGNDVVGAVTYTTSRAEDTLLDIARRHGLGYEDIVRANPEVDTWLPGEGTRIVLPTRYILPPGPRRGVVLNLAEYRMYYFPQAKNGEDPVVMTYPISIGRMDWETPLGLTQVISKVRNPSWYPPESVRQEHLADGDPLPRVVPPGPQNPLGDFAMRLGLPGYLIHGTNRPAGVGMRVTHGCIRMFPEDIEYVFEHIPVKTPVRIINEPVKFGWDGDDLILEVHRTLERPLEEGSEAEPVDGDVVEEAPVADALTTLTMKFIAVTRERTGQLDWLAAESLVDRADGIPATTGFAIKNAATSAAFE
jgi:L,D-transpeptidase ErfK/SrfK